MLSSAYTSGWLIGRVGARPVLALMAFFPLLMCGTAFLIKEERRRPPFIPRSAGEPEVQRFPGSPSSAGEAELRTAAGGPSGVDEEEEGLLGDESDGMGRSEAHHRAHPEGDCCPRHINMCQQTCSVVLLKTHCPGGIQVLQCYELTPRLV